MRVLIIPEDFEKDQHLLKPIFERLFQAIGKPRARVRVCQNPRLRGIDQALNAERMLEIVERYRGMTDIFILCVDRDGEVGRRQRLDQLELLCSAATEFLAASAWEEIETWVLAGLNLPNEWRWSDVRAEIQVKEMYFEPLADQRGLSDSPGGGRRPLAAEAARRLDTIRQKCPEDFDHLAQRLSRVSG
ncbi:MAG: hypothetical protein F4Y84_16090 [Caldilineaceae bacterium SB0665_bin_25]|nr:hypothetical protein [Caldilineaceae bacterium SB0665_bin_25]